MAISLKRRLALTAVLTLAACTVEQFPIGEWINLITPATGACPELTWSVVVQADRSMGGDVYWDQRRHSSHLTGVLHPDDTLQLSAPDVGGTRDAAVTGLARQDAVTMTIHGSGGACNGLTLAAPIPHLVTPINAN